MENLLGYNSRPIRYSEMGDWERSLHLRLYYKHDEFLRRRIKERRSRKEERERWRLSLLADAAVAAMDLKTLFPSNRAPAAAADVGGGSPVRCARYIWLVCARCKNLCNPLNLGEFEYLHANESTSLIKNYNLARED